MEKKCKHCKKTEKEHSTTTKLCPDRFNHFEARTAWNYGKRKPTIDDCGNTWCNCIHYNDSKLTSAGDGIHQAKCRMCGEYWYN